MSAPKPGQTACPRCGKVTWLVIHFCPGTRVTTMSDNPQLRRWIEDDERYANLMAQRAGLIAEGVPEEQLATPRPPSEPAGRPGKAEPCGPGRRPAPVVPDSPDVPREMQVDYLLDVLDLFAHDLEDMRANGHALGTAMVRRARSIARRARDTLTVVRPPVTAPGESLAAQRVALEAERVVLLADGVPESALEQDPSTPSPKETDMTHEEEDQDAMRVGADDFTRREQPWLTLGAIPPGEPVEPVVCAEMYMGDGYYCTRPRGHHGQHAAGDGFQIIAVWGGAR